MSLHWWIKSDTWLIVLNPMSINLKLYCSLTSLMESEVTEIKGDATRRNTWILSLPVLNESQGHSGQNAKLKQQRPTGISQFQQAFFHYRNSPKKVLSSVSHKAAAAMKAENSQHLLIKTQVLLYQIFRCPHKSNVSDSEIWRPCGEERCSRFSWQMIQHINNVL